MKRLILTIILGILTMSITGCVGYRSHGHWHSRDVVVVTRPSRPPVPAYPRHPRGRPAPPPEPRRHHRY